MNLIIIEPPAIEPVSLDEVYDALRLAPFGSPPTHPHDAMLSRMITSARGDAEKTTKRSFVQQQLRLVWNCFPWDTTYSMYGISSRGAMRDYIELLCPPVIEVLSVQYYDENNSLATVNPANYYLTDDIVPRLRFITAFSSPATYLREDAVRINYLAGYAPEGSPPDDFISNVPAQLKDAILIGVKLLYETEMDPKDRESFEYARDGLLAGFTLTNIA